ncbi:MAG: toll/interleukin-1 receptor domain-containing protein [Clostridia bacterium]|nr:toll/interleukin-1 receptor domain-containing protein [Clostridia bacterium]
MPSFEFLSNNCEKLLREILDNRNPDGSCDLSHWEERFDALNISEDIELRSQFGKLKERGMIFVKWADNIPYLLSVLEDGLSYFELKDLYSPNTEKLEGKLRKKYDVFISHASNDKLDYVSGLVNEIKKLGIEVFYDSDVLSWGDNWKEKILEGTSNSEFAVIVISNSFFGREWTEKELNEFLKRQNESGQKIVLPLLYNISISEMTSKYPHLSEIQAIESTKLTNQDITILLAKEIIKRLKE